MATLVKRKPQSQFATDAEYLRTVKNPHSNDKEKQEATYELYTKYIPLVRKMANKFNLSTEDAQDFESEAFFVVLDVIEYVKPHMIDENFSFGYFLRFRLTNKGIQGVKRSKSREKNLGSKTSWESIKESTNAVPDQLTTSEDSFQSAIHLDVNRRKALEVIDSFKEVSKRDRGIVRDALLGVPNEQLQERYHLSGQRIRKIQKEVVEKLREYVTA